MNLEKIEEAIENLEGSQAVEVERLLNAYKYASHGKVVVYHVDLISHEEIKMYLKDNWEEEKGRFFYDDRPGQFIRTPRKKRAAIRTIAARESRGEIDVWVDIKYHYG